MHGPILDPAPVVASVEEACEKLLEGAFGCGQKRADEDSSTIEGKGV